ncbi:MULTISPECIES: hypothetical protein [unclassified Luteimonas]
MSTDAKPQTQKPAARTRTRTSGRKNDRGSSLTSERIADDLAAFRKDGGKIEVLGTTTNFKNTSPMRSASKTARTKKAPAKAAKKRA